MNIDQLSEKLSEIRNKGYVVSLRRGNTGIGYTLETLLGVQENNLKIPDFGDVELKSQRRETTSRLTMFTFNRGVWQMEQKEVIDEYGYIDANGRPSLYCIVNSTPNNQGLFLKVEEEMVRLYHVDKTLIAHWPGEGLIDTFKKKMPSLVVVYADTRVNSDEKEEFWFNEADLLTDPDEDNFLDLIRKDIVVVDLRMHLRNNNVVRNHGTGFRIEEKFLNLCFGRRDKII